MNGALFDSRHVRRAFGRAAAGYAEASAVQREIESRLLESLDHYALRHGEAAPARVLDLACGPARAAHALRARWPKAEVIAADAALPMLRAARANTRGHWLRAREIARVAADLRVLPFAEDAFDLLFCNLALQWIDDLPAAFAEFRRVLKPGGMLLVSTFGSETLAELREAFATADVAPHVSPFTAIAPFGDALVAAGFREPVLDRDVLVEAKPSFRAILDTLRAMGATNALGARRHTLSGRARFAAAEAAHARAADGWPMRWEAIYAQAWAPEPGTPIRDAHGELARVPLARIPIRRR
ncbi:methyltransferase domain-containing protein [Lysobacter pythonis]|uniref:Malonyl-[acyl-carrier protein] O-methyltransferase n=1 Tax=Solilutibacter pythonis TaxID=2483112 RepID=A0A3M2I667_9GAMM|nr:methyltransferase domain-containing protein [Lysobacter pythonis]RMH93764.1 methyltransferase domain-containing protein [Lysobacter pythonis]